MDDNQIKYLLHMAREYHKCKMKLIPLGKFQDWITLDNGKELPSGKVPWVKDWRTSKFSLSYIIDHIGKGHNIGFLLGDKDLVVDVDPRNGGLEGLKVLEEDLGYALEDVCPTVVTGSGGFHFYFKKSDTVKYKEYVERYGKGVEFKTVGRQVVIPGSLHPGESQDIDAMHQGSPYVFEDLGLEFKNTPITPFELEKQIIRESSDSSADSGLMSCESVSELLAQIPVEEYDDNSSWLELMMSVHFATDGAAIEEFLEWSTSDPKYANDHQQIRYRWNSLDTDKADSYTHRTLLHHAEKHGVNTKQYEAHLDFDIVDEDIVNVTLDSEAAAAQLQSLMSQVDPEELALNLTHNYAPEDLEECLLACLKANTIVRMKCLKIIQKTTGLTKNDLKAIMKEIEERSIKDLGEILAGYVLEKKFNKGKHLIYNIDGEFWEFNGKCWSPLREEWLAGQVVSVWQKIRDRIGMTVTTTTIVHQCVSLLRMTMAVKDDVFGFKKPPKPIINCQNHEIWLKSDGSYVLKNHSYKSYMTHCLNVEFDELADCPLWDASIEDIFSMAKDPQDMVRHFEEFMGYVIQPNKNIASWWMLKGFGSNGKSMVMEVIGSLMGTESVLSTSIHDLNTTKNNHALADLPGKLMVLDDDLDTHTMLPDGLLKKVSERKLLNCNPKGQKPFNFISCSTPVLLTNYFPKARDVSNGTRRRCNVIPFDRQYDGSEIDRSLPEKLKSKELSGILNRALHGLRRLRTRQYFDKPHDCVVAETTWLSEANTVPAFLKECCDVSPTKGSYTTLKDLYATYEVWHKDQGVNSKIIGKRTFAENLAAMGYEVYAGGGKQRRVKGIKIIKNEVDMDFDDD